MDFATAIQNGFRNYASANGRASRSEYWYWSLFSTLVAVAGWGLDYVIFGQNLHGLLSQTGVFSLLFGLVLLLPDVAVTLRRLHDLDRSGMWILIIFTIIGIVLLLIWCCMRGTEGPNRWGEDPVQQEAGA